jgi:hypothetical protein
MKSLWIFRMIVASVFVTGVAHATTITFTASTPDPNGTGSSITGGYGSDANVSVGYSPSVYTYASGYGTLAGTGAAAYDDNTDETLTMTFTAAAGYTVTLNSFDLAAYEEYNTPGYYNYPTDITVTGGATTYTNNGSYPDGYTYTTYSPNETGTSLTLTITDLYYVGINDISYTENAVPVSATPEPSSLILSLTGVFGLVAAGFRRRRALTAC